MQSNLKQQNTGKDLIILVLVTLIPLIIYVVLGNRIMQYVRTSTANIWMRAFPVMLIQFGLAGLGSLIILLYRKEKLTG